MELEYESQDEFIKAVFDSVIECLRVRDSYAVGVKFGERVIPYGPFYDLTKAKKEGGRYSAVLETPVFVEKLLAPSKLDDPTEESTA